MQDRDQIDLFSANAEYDEFVKKFEPKKTTDDCYTPEPVYEAVKWWACKEYGIDPASIVRPFWPDSDYRDYDYPPGCTALDNPPFSLLSQIIDYYSSKKIPFFLFAPSLTALSGRKCVMKVNHIITDSNITYDNGAVVRTAFVTSYGGDVVIQTAPGLARAVDEAVAALRRERVKQLPKYRYPDSVLTTAAMQRLARYGVALTIRRGECAYTPKLDAQRAAGKAIFGGGAAAILPGRRREGRRREGRRREGWHYRVAAVGAGAADYCRAG